MSTLAAAPAATPPAPARARIRGAGWGVWLAFGLIAAFLRLSLPRVAEAGSRAFLDEIAG